MRGADATEAQSPTRLETGQWATAYVVYIGDSLEMRKWIEPSKMTWDLHII